MPVTIWRVFAPLDQIAGLDLEADAIQLINEYFDSARGPSTQVSMLAASTLLPNIADLEKKAGRITDPIKSRLLTARCLLELENPGRLATSPLQVSILQFVLRRAGKCIIQWDDQSFQFGEDALKEISQHANVGTFGDSEPQDVQEEGTEEARYESGRFSASGAEAIANKILASMESMHQDSAEETTACEPVAIASGPIDRFLEILEFAQEDPDRAADLRLAIGRLPTAAHQVLRAAASQGAKSETELAQQLRLSEAAMEQAVKAIETMFRRLDLWEL